MRGQASAIFILGVNLIGFGLGPSIIAFFTDFIFSDDFALPYSMAMTALLIVPPSMIAFWRCLGAYRLHLSESNQWR
ncbi:hypothetical protein [Oceanicoccus sp. KOV_DT_Chl]|uniref:hypothetical protein n=1 Tax=Oceanicoccus sp. KOV_DT_Chl TaxID=1904639 RepID=UPI000C7E6A59|nr:hypothetical protein [Oceanicoccus sp. KOV_DT_Chl]